MLPAGLILLHGPTLNHYLVHDPYFGGNNVGDHTLDRNSNERCGNSGTHKEMALVTSLQGPLRTLIDSTEGWRKDRMNQMWSSR